MIRWLRALLDDLHWRWQFWPTPPAAWAEMERRALEEYRAGRTRRLP